MTSAALVDWSTTRATRLDNLLAAHRALGGGTPGRKWLTVEINHSLIVRLASEFQGFCRDLHDEAIAAVLREKFPYDYAMGPLVRALLENSRKLDSGNASWGNVGADFARLGISLKDELSERYPRKYPKWVTKLDRLNDARNAIAHDDRTRLADCIAVQPLTLSTFHSWRSALTEVASGLDAVVGAYLKDLNGRRPW